MAMRYCVCFVLVFLPFHRATETLADKTSLKDATLKFNPRSFTIDYDKNTFMKDGQPFRYISGSIHYSRVPQYYWKDRLMKMYAAGLDAAQIYVPWNVHEPSQGVYDFEGQQDLVGFLKTAQEVGLLVILRAGPYICGEWEFGGFPPWLLKKNASVVLRSSDPQYLGPVDQWLSVLLPTIKPMLYENGGPVIMVQTENEYGSFFTCDHNYTLHLRDQFRHYLGDNVVLFTTDGAGDNYLKCGKIEGVYATVDFGAGGNVSAYFKAQRDYEPKGPLVNSEFYTGWLDHWGSPHSVVATDTVTKYLDQILSLGANVNMYMFEGGTNFGFMNGANMAFSIIPTSYDYDSPLTEAGDVTEKYMAIRATIGKHKTLPKVPIPPSTPKYAYGTVQMSSVTSLLDQLDVLSQGRYISAKSPLSMEQIGQNYGFIMYRTVLSKHYPLSLLSVSGLRDMAYVITDGVVSGILDRNGQTSMNLFGPKNAVLDILVENQGRINYGSDLIGQRKGIISNVTLGGITLQNWKIYPINLQQLNTTSFRQSVSLTDRSVSKKTKGYPVPYPAFYSGTFKAPNRPGFPQDTYLNMEGWFKGQAFMNGFNLGRYWPEKRPQVTLYVPAGVLKPYPADNTLTMLELQWSPCSRGKAGCSVNLTTQYIINATISSDQPQPQQTDDLWDSHHLH